jgi:hypothetical protein
MASLNIVEYILQFGSPSVAEDLGHFMRAPFRGPTQLCLQLASLSRQLQRTASCLRSTARVLSCDYSPERTRLLHYHGPPHMP